MDSLPTASTPHDADDAEVGSQEGTHQEERAPEVSHDNLPDFARTRPQNPQWLRSPAGDPFVRRAKP